MDMLLDFCLDRMTGQAMEQNWDFATMMGSRLADCWVAAITMVYPLDFCLVGIITSVPTTSSKKSIVSVLATSEEVGNRIQSQNT